MVAGHIQTDLHHVVGSLRSVGRRAGRAGGGGGGARTWPFVTISRQAGAGGYTLGTLLAERLNGLEYAEARLGSLNETQPPPPWQCLDRELVERIARDHHLSAGLIDSLQHSSHTWIGEFFGGLSHTDNQPSELAVFRRVAETVRALAEAGHVLLVGLGSVFMTRDMPGGVHVRLVAPLEYRVRTMAKKHNLSESHARAMVENLDAGRDSFYRQYWPHTPLHAGLFHITLNAGLMREEQMVDCVLPLIRKKPEARSQKLEVRSLE
ncbi:MAG: cytidylate kinase-like family protein [Phycisphaerales bacterium]|nr:cytidylate kinase-like family protein [Phycisphaerales bacterium]